MSRYNSTLPVYEPGITTELQTDQNGRLLTSGGTTANPDKVQGVYELLKGPLGLPDSPCGGIGEPVDGDE